LAVATLSGAWILELLRENHPDGVLRRALLDQFAAILVTARSRRGAKGRVARRLYTRLASLERKGLVAQEEGIVRPILAGQPPKDAAMPLLGPVLRRKQFTALLVEDRNEQGPGSPELQAARWEFLACAVQEGWTIAQAGSAIGLPAGKAAAVIAAPPPNRDRGFRNAIQEFR
jgi:hypothetical protein